MRECSRRVTGPHKDLAHPPSDPGWSRGWGWGLLCSCLSLQFRTDQATGGRGVGKLRDPELFSRGKDRSPTSGPQEPTGDLGMPVGNTQPVECS